MCILATKHWHIIIVSQDGQSLFRVILNKVGYDGIANLIGSDPMMIVGKEVGIFI